jgi:hypothetical protein
MTLALAAVNGSVATASKANAMGLVKNLILPPNFWIGIVSIFHMVNAISGM